MSPRTANMLTDLAAFFLIVLVISGCAIAPGLKTEPVAVSGIVLLPSGQPVRNVTMHFFPTNSGQVQGSAQLKEDGRFSVMLTPGRYTFSFEPFIRGPLGSMKPIPLPYHNNDAAHTIEVPNTGVSGLSIRLIT